MPVYVSCSRKVFTVSIVPRCTSFNLSYVVTLYQMKRCLRDSDKAMIAY